MKITVNNKFNENFFGFNRSFKLILSLLFKSEKTWIFNIFLPFFIIIAILYSFSSFSNNILLPPQILSLFLVCPLFSSMYVVMNFNDWKNTYILQRIKFTAVSKGNIVFSLYFNVLILSLVSLVFNFMLIWIFSYAFSDIPFLNLKYLYFWNWLYFLLVVFLSSLLFYLISIVISNLINKKAISNGILILYFIFVISSSDIIIPSFIGSKSEFLYYFNYINIFKYISWFSLLTSSFTFIDYVGGIEQIVQSEGEQYYVFIKSIYIGMLLPLLLAIPLYFANIKAFKWKGN